MLFNSTIFIFGFLPVVLLIYWGLHRAKKSQAALSFLVPASLVFYAYWNPPFVLLLIGSILFNFICGNYIANGAGNRTALAAAITINLALLCWFKYAAMLAETINVTTGTALNPGNIFLPLGVSFFTFHQITYLIDVYKGKISPAGFRNYALYVGFFPQLIAGPIVRAWEIVPQFENFTGREKFWRNMALGTGFFIVGLFKKVFIADTLALYAAPVFEMAKQGKPITFFDGWSGALAYTFQLYFDFSGYSDMAIGIALMLGFVLPINFLSPYKSTSIIEFWRRWHITMSRFFRDYLYIPLGGNHGPASHKIFNLTVTMFLAGLWHGAGWTFAAWGLLHGVYLAINHIFTTWREKHWANVNMHATVYKIPAHILTILAVVLGWVLFRAENFDSAMRIFKAMSGAEGMTLPRRFSEWVGTDGWLHAAGIGERWIATSSAAFFWVGTAYILCLTLPASVEYFGLSESQSKCKFTLNKRTAIALGALAVIALFSMQRISEFLYFQF
ncbi:MAG: MBOAT family protein [Alphaproteobacteria bacterium PRO2]|nr:MBOAT family protein [Alphaproteobacteria bacterium PRO2]